MTTSTPTPASMPSGKTNIHADAFCRLLVSRRHLERAWSRAVGEVALRDQQSGATLTIQAEELEFYLSRRPPGGSPRPA